MLERAVLKLRDRDHSAAVLVERALPWFGFFVAFRGEPRVPAVEQAFQLGAVRDEELRAITRERRGRLTPQAERRCFWESRGIVANLGGGTS